MIELCHCCAFSRNHGSQLFLECYFSGSIQATTFSTTRTQSSLQQWTSEGDASRSNTSHHGLPGSTAHCSFIVDSNKDSTRFCLHTCLVFSTIPAQAQQFLLLSETNLPGMLLRGTCNILFNWNSTETYPRYTYPRYHPKHPASVM